MYITYTHTHAYKYASLCLYVCECVNVNGCQYVNGAVFIHQFKFLQRSVPRLPFHRLPFHRPLVKSYQFNDQPFDLCAMPIDHFTDQCRPRWLRWKTTTLKMLGLKTHPKL